MEAALQEIAVLHPADDGLLLGKEAARDVVESGHLGAVRDVQRVVGVHAPRRDVGVRAGACDDAQVRALGQRGLRHLLPHHRLGVEERTGLLQQVLSPGLRVVPPLEAFADEPKDGTRIRPGDALGLGHGSILRGRRLGTPSVAAWRAGDRKGGSIATDEPFPAEGSMRRLRQEWCRSNRGGEGGAAVPPGAAGRNERHCTVSPARRFREKRVSVAFG